MLWLTVLQCKLQENYYVHSFLLVEGHLVGFLILQYGSLSRHDR